MSLLELGRALSAGWPVALGVSLGAPLVLWLWGTRQARDRESPAYGHTASLLVALGLVTMVLAVLTLGYLHGQGTDLVADVPVLALFAPFWFGGGNLLAATRRVSFTKLRTYPLLRRVWAVLSLGAVVFAGWMVLRHTYWLVFSGLVGFVVVAIVAYTLFRKLGRRASSPPPEGGDPDLFDDVAAGSRHRVKRFLGAVGRRRP